jgi:hypothetical protein
LCQELSFKVAASSACEVNAGEREGDEEINDEESDDTINTAFIPYFFASACRSLLLRRHSPRGGTRLEEALA